MPEVCVAVRLLEGPRAGDGAAHPRAGLGCEGRCMALLSVSNTPFSSNWLLVIFFFAVLCWSGAAHQGAGHGGESQSVSLHYSLLCVL